MPSLARGSLHASIFISIIKISSRGGKRKVNLLAYFPQRPYTQVTAGWVFPAVPGGREHVQQRRASDRPVPYPVGRPVVPQIRPDGGDGLGVPGRRGRARPALAGR